MLVLMFYIPTDDELIDSDGGDEVAPGPKGFLFIQSMRPFDFFLHPGTIFTLDQSHGVGNTVPGITKETKVDVVVLNIQFQDLPVLPLANGFKDAPEFTLDLAGGKDFTPVFGSPDQVVFQVIETM